MKKIYLDYAATSLKHNDIIENCFFKIKDIYANTSSQHTIGKKNNKLLKEAREKIASSINANTDEIIFTSGGSESNNTVFNHILKNYDSGEIIISNIEHPSVKNCAENLKNYGFKIIEINVKQNGIIDINELKNLINENTILISIMYANNETGTIQPIKEISEIIKDKNILLHSDIVQTYCKTEIDVKDLSLDFASVSAHKIGATNNFGFLYVKNSKISPLILGGSQENGLRAGTVDLLGALTLAECIDITKNNLENIKNLKFHFLEKLKNENIDFEINCDIHNSLGNILNIYFKNIKTERLLTYLDINDIYISGGSACSSGNIKASEIISKIYDINRAENSVRFSFGFTNTFEEINYVVEKIKILEEKIKKN